MNAIKARAKRLLWFFCWFGILFLVISAIFVYAMNYFVHIAIGTYGLSYNTGGYFGNGIWFTTFATLEYSIQEYMVAGIVFGMIVGSLGMLGVVRRWNKKEDAETEGNSQLE